MDPREHSDTELLSTARRLIGAGTRGLGLSENEAFRRIAAARLGRRFPIVHSPLASGAVHLTTLELLREHLTDENHIELLESVSGKTKREVEALLATRFPRPDAPARIRQLSRESFKVEFTASAELRDKLELCRDLLAHANPSRDLAAVIERAVDLLLAELESKRLARTKRPRHEPATRDARPARVANPARVTSATRRKVFDRDGLQCAYVSPDGCRCQARAFLELDHAEPRALGGKSDSENLRVRCRAHNQLAAEQAFGREAIERARHFGRPKRKHPSSDTAKIQLALTSLGFGPAQAREAILVATRSREQPRRVA